MYDKRGNVPKTNFLDNYLFSGAIKTCHRFTLAVAIYINNIKSIPLFEIFLLKQKKLLRYAAEG